MNVLSRMPLRGTEENESAFFVHYPLFRATFEGSSYHSSGSRFETGASVLAWLKSRPAPPNV
jgi:hypothetical protein